MPYYVAFEPVTGEIQSFYHSDRHEAIPETAIPIPTTQEYLQVSADQRNYRVNPNNKTLERKPQQ